KYVWVAVIAANARLSSTVDTPVARANRTTAPDMAAIKSTPYTAAATGNGKADKGTKAISAMGGSGAGTVTAGKYSGASGGRARCSQECSGSSRYGFAP